MFKAISTTAYLLIVIFPSAVSGADFFENFDSPNAQGQVLFRGDAIYLADDVMGGSLTGNSPFRNGFVIPNSGTQYFGTPNYGNIEMDQSGSGNFLFNGTENAAHPPLPGYSATFWRSLTDLSVTANATYEFSFYLTNANSTNRAPIQAVVGGVSSPVFNAVGAYPDGNGHLWQRFSFRWTAPTSAAIDLKLVDSLTNGSGNDFGIDTISFVRLSADFDSDHDVDGADFLTWQRGVGTASPTRAQGDANGDIAINGQDLGVWREQVGTPQAFTAVAEPSSFVAFVVAINALAIRRRQLSPRA